jgi:EmrB/QacA subfamily drug resistance transporter
MLRRRRASGRLSSILSGATLPTAWITAQRAAAIAYVTSMFVGAMDTAIINVALPDLSRVFHASNAAVQWTVIAYVLSLAIWIPASGRIADRIGTKRAFLIALAVFTLASALCGQARDLPELVAARALQGAGGGMLMPTGTSMLWRAYPAAQRARLGRLLILPILVAPAAAPVVGGLMVDKLSWRWIFYLNLPFGAIGLLFGALYLVEYREEVAERFDMAGLLLSGGGLCLVLYAISEGAVLGWTAPSVLASATVGLACAAIFVRLELRRTFPILRIALLRQRLFLATNVTGAFSTASFLGILYLTPIFLQEARGQSAVSSGLTTFVEAIGVVVATQTVGRLYAHVGPRAMCTAGLVLLTAVIGSMTTISAETSIWTIRAMMFMAGAANSMVFLSVQTSMFTGIAPADTGDASAIFNTNRQTSLALGVAILSSVVDSVGGQSFAAFRAGYVAAALIALTGGAAAFALIQDGDARATMVRRRIPRPATPHEDPSQTAGPGCRGPR